MITFAELANLNYTRRNDLYSVVPSSPFFFFSQLSLIIPNSYDTETLPELLVEHVAFLGVGRKGVT